MTDAELNTLRWFDREERRQDGQLIQWTVADYLSFFRLNVLREELDAPIQIIRETHVGRKGEPNPWDHTAVDFKPLGVPLWQAIQTAERFDGVSLGWYATGSGHLDRREWDEKRSILPARWLAVLPEDRPLLAYLDLLDLVTEETSAWIYLSMAHPRSHEAVTLVCRLADQRNV